MESFIEKVTAVNDVVNGFAWGWYALILLLGTGLVCTIITKVFQVSHLKHWWSETIASMFKKDTHHNKDSGSVSQFQALCTALAATIGTGNIAGVASAICVGGPGAVFWMWVAAFLGMMTNYSENILGIYYRRKNDDGEWSGGPMYYLREGLGSYKGCKTLGKILAVVFACFAMLASFGIGNMGQINKITINIESAFFTGVNAPMFGGVSIINWIIGIVLMLVGGFIILGGLQRVASFAERVVPFMAIVYVIGALVIFICNIGSIGPMFTAIFKFAFTPVAVAGGISGSAVKWIIDNTVKQGCKRGVFSNEAGLGSSVMVHSNSNVIEPVKQGMWGIFEVFADTMIVCTMTAIVVLSSGLIDLKTGIAVEGINDATLVATAFGKIFGKPGEMFVAIAVLLFAFTTVMGWSHYGSKAVEYLFGTKGVKVYRVFFVLLMVSGAVMTSSLAWDISDTFNGLMMIPNLIGVISLTPVIVKITRNYVDRNIKGKDVAPILSAIPEIQAEMEAKLKEAKENK